MIVFKRCLCTDGEGRKTWRRRTKAKRKTPAVSKTRACQEKKHVRDRQDRHLIEQRSPDDLLNRAVRVQVDSRRRCHHTRHSTSRRAGRTNVPSSRTSTLDYHHTRASAAHSQSNAKQRSPFSITPVQSTATASVQPTKTIHPLEPGHRGPG